jgi:hypothetical protein
MLNEENKYQEELSSIMNNLADSELEITDEEIAEECRADGDTDAENVRQILLNSVKACRQKTLRQARENYIQKFHSFQDTKFDIPELPDEKRNLIQAMLGNIAAQNQLQLTAQFRDFKDMPDEDLDGILQQIYALQSTEQSNENS